MAVDESFETQKINFNAQTPVMVRFDAQVDKVYLRTTADCFIDFDQEAGKESGFLLKPTDGIKDFSLTCVWVSVIGDKESGTLYIGGARK
jgi:hypothetical protein